MNNAPLDKYIKDRFSNYAPDVPSHIWDKIVAEKDKRRPAGFWLKLFNSRKLFILAGLILTAGLLLIYNNQHSTSENTENNITRSSLPGPKQPGTSAEHRITAVNNETSTSPVSQPNENVKPEATEPIHSIAASTGRKNSRKENLPGNNGNANQKLPFKTISLNNPATGTYTEPARQNAIAGSMETASPDNNVKGTSSKSRKSKSSLKMNQTAAMAVSDEDDAKEEMLQPGIIDISLNRLLINPLLIRKDYSPATAVKKPAVPFLEIPCPASESNAAANKRYFEFYGGPDYAFRSISDTGNSAYLQKRKESIRFSSAFSAGIRYTKVFNNGMSIRTGINYSQINEKFSYADANITHIVYITNSNGDTTGSFISTGTRYKTTHNKFRTLDIPLLIGYELGNGRWHANFNAGIIVNLYSWQKGDVLDTAYKPVNITTGKASSPYQFKNNVGAGFLGSISVYYKLNNHLHLLAEPYFRYSFSPVSKSDLTLRQKYNTMGLRLGLRIDF